MPEIQLKGPAIINGAVRYPIEGSIPVTDDEERRQREHDNVADGEGDDLADKKLAELKKTAAEESVDLGDANTKAEITAAIRAHRAKLAE